MKNFNFQLNLWSIFLHFFDLLSRNWSDFVEKLINNQLRNQNWVIVGQFFEPISSVRMSWMDFLSILKLLNFEETIFLNTLYENCARVIRNFLLSPLSMKNYLIFFSKLLLKFFYDFFVGHSVYEFDILINWRKEFFSSVRQIFPWI